MRSQPCPTRQLVGDAAAVRPRRPLHLARPGLRVVAATFAAACIWAVPRGAFTAPSQAQPNEGEAAERELSRSALLRGVPAFGLGALALPVVPEEASAKSFDEAKEAITTYGCPEIIPQKDAPSGYSWNVEPVGLTQDAEATKMKVGSEPLLLVFATPSYWVISRPNIDFNGAAGTVAANDYGKGDTATFYVDSKYTGKLADLKKGEAKKLLLRALQIKGKDMLEFFEITKISDMANGYKKVEYTYEVESPTGLFLRRFGVACVSQVGDKGLTQVFWTAIVSTRWTDMEATANIIVDSVAVAKIPQNVKIELSKAYKDFDQDFSVYQQS